MAHFVRILGDQSGHGKGTRPVSGCASGVIAGSESGR
jgi:hypothetical protein